MIYCLTAPFSRELFCRYLALTMRAGIFEFLVTWHLISGLFPPSVRKLLSNSRPHFCLCRKTQDVSSLRCTFTFHHYSFCIVLGRRVHTLLLLKMHKSPNVQFFFLVTQIKNCICFYIFCFDQSFTSSNNLKISKLFNHFCIQEFKTQTWWRPLILLWLRDESKESRWNIYHLKRTGKKKFNNTQQSNFSVILFILVKKNLNFIFLMCYNCFLRWVDSSYCLFKG